MNLSSSAVLDSHAILSFLKGEKGASRVEKYLANANRGAGTLFLNMINAGELPRGIDLAGGNGVKSDAHVRLRHDAG